MSSGIGRLLVLLVGLALPATASAQGELITGLGGQAGFDAGDSRTYEILPGSGTGAVLDLCRTSNVGVPGIWEFDIYRGTPQMSLPATDGVESQDFSSPRRAPRRRRER